MMGNATEQAIDWFVRLDSGDASTQDRQAFDDWLRESPLHAQAWAALQQRLSSTVDTALVQLRQHGNSPLGRQALVAPIPSAARRRSLLGGGLASLVAAVTAGWWVHRETPLSTLAADLRTGTGERMQHLLPDGSEITLDARSAVDIDYSPSQRLVRLRQGAVMVNVAAHISHRPFVVQSEEGTVMALGTRFMVRQQDGRSLVHVSEHSVRLTTRDGQHTSTSTSTTQLEEGRSAWLEADRITPIDTESMAADAWVDGVIDVRNQSLAEVIDALRPYQSGVIRVSPEAGKLRIFGVFTLADPEQVLQVLVNTHPIRIRRWGHWLIVIDALDTHT